MRAPNSNARAVPLSPEIIRLSSLSVAPSSDDNKAVPCPARNNPSLIVVLLPCALAADISLLSGLASADDGNSPKEVTFVNGD